MESTLNPCDFEYIAKLVKDEAGITLSKGKEYLVLSRVDPVAKSLGFDDIARLVINLQQTSDRVRRRQVVESLTTHETSFFRDNEPFEALRVSILPELIEKQRAKKELTIWCAAASSGQEPYSLCMLLKEHFPELATWRVKFIATDVSNAILSKARSGTFNQIEINRGLPVRFLAKYFEKVGQEWKLKPEIVKMVQFEELNLLHPFRIIPNCDLVMIRNVLIYFDVDTKKQILEKVYNILSPHGYMLLGTAETTLNISDKFSRIAVGKISSYRKVAI